MNSIALGKGWLGVMLGLFDFLHTMEGPDFLLLYAIWGFLIWIGVLILRYRGFDTPLLTIFGIFLYELLAFVRILVGSAYGMHRWGFLIIMMIVGVFFFVLRSEHFDNMGGSGGSGSSCSGGSSCGGGSGCGGGGGCGGCGGG